MPKGRPRQEVILTEEEQRNLEGILRKHTTGQAIALRAKIVLLCAQGLSDVQVARKRGIPHTTAGKWRKRFLCSGSSGRDDAPRSGAPRTITDDNVARVIKLTLESKPENATHWSTRSMARKCGMSQGAIFRIWHAFGLKPHLCDTFKLSSDPLFIEKLKGLGKNC